MSTPWRPRPSGATAKADQLAKSGLGVGSIYRMVKYEFGHTPSLAHIEKLVAAEKVKRDRLRKRYA